jgi:heme/copper-type cytochrome/quinol oxidase subunit 2
MGRSLLAIFSIAGAVAWLVLSYLPGQSIPVNIAFPGGATDALFRTLLYASALLFLFVQIVLLGSTFRMTGRVGRTEMAASRDSVELPYRGRQKEIRIRRTTEFVWTAVPLIMMAGLFVLSFGL